MRILLIILMVTLPIVIILTNARLVVFNERYYERQFLKNNVYSKIPKADLILENITAYLKGEDKVLADLTEDEKRHMKDVRQLFNKFLLSYYILVILDIILIILLLYSDKKQFKHLLLATSLVVFGLAIASLIIGASFETFFTKFHLAFFPQGNYVFPANSVLVTLFPEKFFQTTFITFFVRSLAAASIFLGLFVVLNKRKKH
jgi:integral membrane protein (TIGR01906 family)